MGRRADRPGTPWEVRWRTPDGRSRRRQFRRRTDADAWAATVEADKLRGAYIDPRATTTFRAYAEQWRATQVHRATTATRVEGALRLHAYPAFGHRHLSAVLPSHVQGWVAALARTLAASTVAVVHGIVAAVFAAAVRDRLIASSPCAGTSLPARHRTQVTPLTATQVAAVAAAAPPWLGGLVTVAAATGLRLGEALGVTVDRSGLAPPTARPVLRVDRQLIRLPGVPPYLGPVKRPASRRAIPLPAVAASALAAHLAACPARTVEVGCRDEASRAWVETVELVFARADGSPLRRGQVYRGWRAACTAAGLPEGARFHDLRHFYASLLIDAGESAKVVQARLGHASAAETWDTYVHLWPESEDRTRAAVDAVLGGPGVPGVSQAGA